MEKFHKNVLFFLYYTFFLEIIVYYYYNITKKKKNYVIRLSPMKNKNIYMAPRLETLRGGSLLFTTKTP